MEQWLESVYSDGTEEFVSSPSPSLGETVRVRIRMYEDAPVQHVLLRSLHNGTERIEEAERIFCERGLAYYEAPLAVTENRIEYQFYLVCSDVVYFCTQRGITTYVPDDSCNFVLLADYVRPEWVRDAVFYQIFPERFCNGDPDNDVRTDEYFQDGFGTIRMEDWNREPLPYEKGHCLDFFGGDLAGIEKKLPYLKELGVTALYINPIFIAPSVHKYDCIDFFHVDPHFGGDEALARLSRAVHKAGMKLILDISINHTGTSHKWFNRDGQFFDLSVGAYHNPDSRERGYYFFGKDNSYHGWLDHPNLPTLNYTSRELREEIFSGEDSVLRKWLKPPYEIDGWRFDVADVFARNDEIQLSHELWPQIRRSIRDVNPQAYILAEDWGDCTEYLQGGEWDSPMNYFACARVIRQFLGQPDLFMERSPILRAVPYKMTAADVENRVMQYFARIPCALQQNQFNLIDSHDVSRLHNDPRMTEDDLRIAVVFQFMLPGAACIYYGDEAGVGGVLGTNEGCRYPMPWGSGFENGAAYRLHRTMTSLKAGHAAFSRGGMKFLCAEGAVLVMARFVRDEAFVCVLSTETGDRTVRIPFGALGAVGPKGSEDLFGQSLVWEQTDPDSGLFTVHGRGAYLIECRMKERL